MSHQNGRYARLRDTATGALAVLAVVGAIAGTAALAARPHTNTHGHAAMANGSTTKTPTSPVPGKTHTPQPGSNQPFFNTIQQLVDNGKITATEGQALDREIRAGRVDTDTLASSRFTPTQLQAVAQALGDTKRAMARNVQ
jgi:hypothetical protein